ncbi:MAG TPA: DnaD domain protein [Clostridiales bacterium]|nr:DnaD domain protein [Clostridiales bacterium]HPV02808.1 DnaD domain protein [Clostridiales bacterium]
MVFDVNFSMLYSDTLVPDVFISEYMPSLESDFVKVYIYCLFLSRYRKNMTPEMLAKKLELRTERVKDALTRLEDLGLITRSADGNEIIICDVKEKEIRKVYRAKTTSTPEEAELSMERSKKRSKFISSINNAFFQGVMSPSWYTDIDAWFDKYGFEEDVMYALFKHCYDHNGLSRQYITKVADNWYSKNIRNSFDLDRYSMEAQKIKDIRGMIMKKLRRRGSLTEYEDAYIEKWVSEYNFDADIIEEALRRTTSAQTPSFEYINRILTNWHEKGYKTKEEILAAENTAKVAKHAKPRAKESAVPQKGNFEQRKYDDEYFDKLYKDV